MPQTIDLTELARYQQQYKRQRRESTQDYARRLTGVMFRGWAFLGVPREIHEERVKAIEAILNETSPQCTGLLHFATNQNKHMQTNTTISGSYIEAVKRYLENHHPTHGDGEWSYDYVRDCLYGTNKAIKSENYATVINASNQINHA